MRPRRCGLHDVMSCPSSSTVPAEGKSKPVRTLTSVVLPAPFGPIKPTTSCRCNSSVTPLSAWIPSNARETSVARRASPGHPLVLLERVSDKLAAYLRLTTFLVFHIRRYVSLLFCTFMMRHGRPVTLCSVGEYVTGPEIVGTLWNFWIAAASFAPSVDPPVCFSAWASTSIVAAPSTKLAV